MDTDSAAVELSDGGPVERFERFLLEPVERVMGEICARVVEGDSLGTIARDMGLPRHRFILWVSGDQDRREQYEGALRMRADELVHDSLHMMTNDPANHALKVAALWDKRRFGRGDDSSGMKVVVVRFSEGSTPAESAALENNSDGG